MHLDRCLPIDPFFLGDGDALLGEVLTIAPDINPLLVTGNSFPYGVHGYFHRRMWLTAPASSLTVACKPIDRKVTVTELADRLLNWLIMALAGPLLAGLVYFTVSAIYTGLRLHLVWLSGLIGQKVRCYTSFSWSVQIYWFIQHLNRD